MNLKERSNNPKLKFLNRLNYNVLLYLSYLIVLAIIGSSNDVQSGIARYLGLVKPSETLQTVIIDGKMYEVSRVQKVLDGDTVLLEDGRQIRYLNVDTPETKKPNTPVQCFGKESSDYNQSQANSKKVYLLADKQDKDIYGRYLRFVFIEGVDVSKIQNSLNYLLVVNGFARSLIIKPNNTYQEIFKNASDQAKLNNLGVWSCPNPFTL